MPNDGTSVRAWKEIVAKALGERDPEKLRNLAEELERAPDERAKTPAHVTHDRLNARHAYDTVSQSLGKLTFTEEEHLSLPIIFGNSEKPSKNSERFSREQLDNESVAGDLDVIRVWASSRPSTRRPAGIDFIDAAPDDRFNLSDYIDEHAPDE